MIIIWKEPYGLASSHDMSITIVSLSRDEIIYEYERLAEDYHKSIS